MEYYRLPFQMTLTACLVFTTSTRVSVLFKNSSTILALHVIELVRTYVRTRSTSSSCPTTYSTYLLF